MTEKDKDKLTEKKLLEERLQEEKARLDEVWRQRLKLELDDPMVRNPKPSFHAPLIPCIKCRKTHRKGECKGG
jgi:hypothetical protein